METEQPTIYVKWSKPRKASSFKGRALRVEGDLLVIASSYNGGIHSVPVEKVRRITSGSNARPWTERDSLELAGKLPPRKRRQRRTP